MFDRFDFEQQIMKVWSITDDLDLLLEGVLEKDMSKDDISNVLLGLKELHNMRTEKLFDMFELGIAAKKIT